MNCTDALAEMLAADLEVLKSSTSSDLARHIAGCARCSRVANQLLLDTNQLAVAVRQAAPERRSRLVPRLVLAGGTIAAIVAMLALPGDEATTGDDMRQGTTSATEATVATTGDDGRQAATVATTGDDLRHEANEATLATTGDSRRQEATATAAVAIAPVAYSPVPVPAPVPVALPEPVRPEPVAYALEPGDAVPSPASDGTVQVTPPDGMQATVLATRNPRITVVLLN